MVVSKFSLIHMHQVQQLTNSQLVTKVHPHTMQDCSTVLTFRCRWFVQLVRIHSSLRLVSRHVMVLFRILSRMTQAPPITVQVMVHLQLTLTAITGTLSLQTLCNFLYKDEQIKGWAYVHPFFVLTK